MWPFSTDPRKLKFSKFVESLRKQSGDAYAEEFACKVMDLLMHDSTLTFDQIQGMKYEEVDFRVKRMQREVERNIETLDRLMRALESEKQVAKESAWLNDPEWQYSIGMEDDNR